MIIVDFETRSRVDLPARGSANYVSDGSTEIICAAFMDPETGGKWLWYPGEPLNPTLLYHLDNTDYIAAHNAEFDMGIWECVAVPDHGFPKMRFEQWYCTSAQCRVNALPAGLDDAAFALGLKSRKHASGKHLIKALSIPQEDGTFNEDAGLIIEMGEYCMQDVVVTADVMAATRLMTQREHRDWLNTVKVNERGVKVDTELAGLAMQYAAAERVEIGDRLIELTGGAVTAHTQSARARAWLKKRNISSINDAMIVYKKGEKKESFDKNVRRTLLAMANDGDLFPPDIVEFIQLIDDGNKSSVAKFGKMLSLADDDDDRVRGAFVYAGATQTLRYTSRGLQLHNMRRDCFGPEDTELIHNTMALSEPLDDVMDTLSKLLRPAIIPAEGNRLVVGDWSSIEARVMPWLADTDEADKKLDLFRDGVDVYVDTAKNMGMTEEDRQIGKVAELACGYQGGVNAFQSMARLFGLHIPDEEAKEYVRAWRAANPWAVQFWADLEAAAWEAFSKPGTAVAVGMLDYYYEPNLMDGTLMCVMPNDNIIQYPRVEAATGKFDRPTLMSLKASYRPKADAKTWPAVQLYGGLFAENVTQGFSAAILRNALSNLEDEIDAVIASVHDEIVLEVPKADASAAVHILHRAMNTAPHWAAGLPLVAEPQVMLRYGK